MHNFVLVKDYEGKISTSREAVLLQWLSYKEIKNQHPVQVVENLADKLHVMGLL